MTHSIPVPASYQDIEDRFVTLVSGAPDFERLQRIVTYTITLEMMVNSLVQGINAVALRSTSAAAKSCYALALEEIHAGVQHYASGREEEGKKRFMTAHNIVRSATNKGPRWNVQK